MKSEYSVKSIWGTAGCPVQSEQRLLARAISLLVSLAMMVLMLEVSPALALPAFARQTGQNCVACHAGGQFPELTPYGRMFKMTGYTIGERALPLSVMGVISGARVRDTGKSDDQTVDFQKNNTLAFATGSIFLAGKVTDNIGAFIQNTYNNYAGQSVGADGGLGRFQGHSQADNMDIRYADRLIDSQRDLVFGLSVNNNPSVSDPWSSAAAWMQYVPVGASTGQQFVDGPYPGFGAGGNLAGATVYGYWNKTLYAEVGAYHTANRAFSVFSSGLSNSATTHLSGENPYLRLAYTREWGPHNLMLGVSGMNARIYDDSNDISDPNSLSRIKNRGGDAQYQYLLDPHTLTAQFSYMRQHQDYSANSVAATTTPYFLEDGVTPVAAPNASDTTNMLRAKVSYIYQAKYGGSLSYFDVTGSANTRNQTSGYDSTRLITTSDPNGTGITSGRVGGNLTGNPATRGFTYEAFWTPIQYMRIGAQYTAYNKFNGASTNYDGFGRNAKDNNTLRFYIWVAY
jgi:hypothetical protein